MISITIICFVLFFHFIGDFILQSNWMALNKSKRFEPLLLHVLAYSAPLYLFGIKWAILNAICHFVTDYITSRLASKLWQKEERHWFFVLIGFDQMIHLMTLFYTYILLN